MEIKSFYADVKEASRINNKWMKFEFYFRQPFGLLGLIAATIYTIIAAQGRAGRIAAMETAIVLLLCVMLLYFVMLRKKYSYHCWIAFLALQGFSNVLAADFLFWDIVVSVILLILFVKYYDGRREFFYKERTGNADDKKSLITGSIMGLLLVFLVIFTFMYVKHKEYMESPAKAIECIASDAENTWTKEQTQAAAERWVNAVAKGDTEEICQVIEGIYTEQESSKSFLFLKQKVFKAGIDQKKCGGMLSYIDAEDQGMAYYSLARISHYYDVLTSRNHEMEVWAEETENGLHVILKHGKSEASIAFIDMNEIAGEEGKNNLRKLSFSEEEIVSFLSSVYTDEDIFFIKDLAEDAGGEEYPQVFKNNPDLLSAYGQDALYIYAYVLMKNSVECNAQLQITQQDWGSMENFINGILRVRSSRKERYYCERYLKVLEDKGKTHMDASADQLRQNLKHKSIVASLLPDFTKNAHLNILFNVLKYRLNTGKGISYNKTVQIEEMDSHSLLRDSFQYREIVLNPTRPIETNFDFNKSTIYYDKEVSIRADSGYNSLRVKRLNERFEAEKKLEEIEKDIETSLFGEIIVVNGNVIVGEGTYCANSLLKKLELETNGLSFLADPTMKVPVMEELRKGKKSDIVSDIWETMKQRTSLKEDEIIPALYLIWTGETYEDSEIDNISKLKAHDIEFCMDKLDDLSSHIAYNNEDKNEIVHIDVNSEIYTNYNFFD